MLARRLISTNQGRKETTCLKDVHETRHGCFDGVTPNQHRRQTVSMTRRHGAALYDGWRVEALVGLCRPKNGERFAPQERTAGVRTLRALCAARSGAMTGLTPNLTPQWTEPSDQHNAQTVNG